MPKPRTLNFEFAVAGRARSLDETHPLWSEALPLSVRRPPENTGPAGKVSHGDYFQAIRSYFLKDGVQHLQSALTPSGPTNTPPPSPEQIEVVLEKHGEFYHPARIRVASPVESRSFVLNVAATPVGHECMTNEIQALQKVAPRLQKGSLPEIYGVGQVENPNGQTFRMFLADWFEDHHEFHLSVDPADGRPGIIVWDTRGAPFFLPKDAKADVYAQTAYLLTRAYDFETTRQIYPWHHASGDFVLRPPAKGLDLKLITVRQYAPTLGAADGQDVDMESRLMAAMVFFANLTLRNRIDRLDGTGELAWADDSTVAATVSGFKRAMDEGPLSDLVPLLRSYDLDDWVTLLSAVAEQYRLMPAEDALLDRHIEGHAVGLQAAIRRAFGDCPLF